MGLARETGIVWHLFVQQAQCDCRAARVQRIRKPHQPPCLRPVQAQAHKCYAARTYWYASQCPGNALVWLLVGASHCVR